MTNDWTSVANAEPMMKPRARSRTVPPIAIALNSAQSFRMAAMVLTSVP